MAGVGSFQPSENHRVHFDESKDLVGKENEIIVQKKGNKLDAHLGFLQVNHRYKIAFSVPRSLCETTVDSQVTPIDSPTTSPHVQIINISGSKDKINFQLELFAHKEQLMVEEFRFRLSDLKEPLAVMLTAKVLGKGKGTPLLKNEIHIIHGPVEEGSDASSDFPECD